MAWASRGQSGIDRPIRRQAPVARQGVEQVPCPDCGMISRDPVEARLGFCPRCKDFTGLCGAGRRIICPDIMTKTSWHLPCTNVGVAAWEITLEWSPRVTLLCREHDGQVLSGVAPWIKHARRLTH
jgi:hypothetical protein